MKTIFTTFFLFFVLSVFGQSCDEVLVMGGVRDTLRVQKFYNLLVINKTTGQAVFGQPNGHFTVYANPDDTIVLSCKNYPMIQFRVEADSNCQQRILFKVEPITQELEEVRVVPIKSLEQIKEERAQLAMRETRLVTGINVLQSPITALYQALSRKERSKRKVAEMEYQDNIRKVLKDLLRTYVDADIITLSEEEFDEFIAFLNVDDNFLKTAKESELITFIKDKFEHFKYYKKYGVEMDK